MNQNTMTNEQALKLLDNIAAQVTLTRADHVAVQQAVATLQALVETAAEKPVKAVK